LQWNTFMGSLDDDQGHAIAVDASGTVYVAGDSDASWGSPVNAHAGGDFDAFAAKLVPSSIGVPALSLGGKLALAAVLVGSVLMLRRQVRRKP
jgi:hypothetical protein